MQFKVGDRVKVREDLKGEEEDLVDGWAVAEPMLQFKGKIATILEVYNDYYEISVDNRCWGWTDGMLEKVHEKQLKIEEPKPSLLTEDERVILRNLDKKWKWIARDMEDNNLHIYTLEPTKVIDCWNVAGLDNYENFYIYNHLFQFIKWNDKEPYNIEELLKGEREE